MNIVFTKFWRKPIRARCDRELHNLGGVRESLHLQHEHGPGTILKTPYMHDIIHSVENVGLCFKHLTFCGKVGCVLRGQTAIHMYHTDDSGLKNLGQVWGPEVRTVYRSKTLWNDSVTFQNYIDCFSYKREMSAHELARMNKLPYEILNSSAHSHILLPRDQSGIFVFNVKVVDPHTRYIHSPVACHNQVLKYIVLILCFFKFLQLASSVPRALVRLCARCQRLHHRRVSSRLYAGCEHHSRGVIHPFEEWDRERAWRAWLSVWVWKWLIERVRFSLWVANIITWCSTFQPFQLSYWNQNDGFIASMIAIVQSLLLWRIDYTVLCH